MSLIDKVNSVQGIALAALQATYNINTYLSTFVAQEIGGIPAVSFNNTWSSLIIIQYLRYYLFRDLIILLIRICQNLKIIQLM